MIYVANFEAAAVRSTALIMYEHIIFLSVSARNYAFNSMLFSYELICAELPE